jgi:hypothetical protein
VRNAAALAPLLLVLAFVGSGCESTPSATTTPLAPTAIHREVEASNGSGALVRVDSDLTATAPVRGEIVLAVKVANVGPRDIQDLTVIVSEGYMAEMAVVDTNPNAIRRNEQGGEYFIFSTLPKGATQTYVIKLTPNDVGDFTTNVDVAEWSSSEMLPLPEASGGVAEYAFETQVFAP